MSHAAPLPKVSVRDTRRSTAIALLAGIVAVYDFILFGTLLPRISETFEWSTSLALLVSTLVSIGTALVMFAIGPLVDRVGRRRGMILTVTGTAVASAATAGTVGAASIVAVRSISGLSLSEQSVNATYLNELYNATEDEKIVRNQGFVYSMVQAAWPMGALAAAGFAALCSTFLAPDQWRYVFLLATVPALLVALLCRRLKETPQFEAQQREQTAAPTEKGSLREIFSGRQLRNTVVLSLAWFFNWFGILAFSVLGTSVLENAKGVDASSTLLLVVVSNLVAILGYLLSGWAGDRYGRHRVIVIGWLLATAAFSAMLLGPSSTGFVLVTYMLGLMCVTGPYAAILFFQSECFETHCKATGGAFIFAMSQPGAIIAGFLLSGLTAAGWTYGNATLLVGVGGILLSALVMTAARPVTPLGGARAAVRRDDDQAPVLV